MKKLYFLALAAVVGIALSSCSSLGGNGSNAPSFNLSDLQGLWLQEDDTTQHYVRFTTEQSDQTPYLLGREWHKNDPEGAVYEQDLLDAREHWGHPGDGWFKYEFKTSGTLTEIHLMNNGGADIPKVYVVSKLTSSELSYYEKDRTSNKFNFSRIVESK